MELGRAAEADQEGVAPIRQGWCLGNEEFRRQMLGLMSGQLGDHHAGELRRQNGEVLAERIIAEEWHRLGWSETDLVNQHKNSAGKLEIGARLRRETTVPVKWIAARVHLGTSQGANGNLHQWMKNHPVSLVSSEARPDEQKGNQA